MREWLFFERFIAPDSVYVDYASVLAPVASSTSRRTALSLSSEHAIFSVYIIPSQLLALAAVDFLLQHFKR